MNADGSGQTNLTQSPGSEQWPAWSVDGEEIFFQSNRDGNWEIYAMAADGSDQTRVTNNPASDTTPSGASATSPMAEQQLGECLDVTNTVWSFRNDSKEWRAFSPGLPAPLQGFTALAQGAYFANVNVDCTIAWGQNVIPLSVGWNLFAWR
jgi:hypothetical protein